MKAKFFKLKNKSSAHMPVYQDLPEPEVTERQWKLIIQNWSEIKEEI